MWYSRPRHRPQTGQDLKSPEPIRSLDSRSEPQRSGATRTSTHRSGRGGVTAYGHVNAVLKKLLAEDRDSEPKQHDALALAQAAANRGLVH